MEPVSIHRHCDDYIDKARDRATKAEDRCASATAWAWTFGILFFITVAGVIYFLPACIR